MNTRNKWPMLALLMVIAGCDSGHGPDSIFNHNPHSRGTVSMCTQCHSSANSPALDPLVTNGSGTFGKHIKHVQERGIECERCHYNYLSASTHMNGIFDTGNPTVKLVNMNIVGPSGIWTNNTGAGTGSCSVVACHGNATLDWYGTNTWTLPACTTCHVSSFSSALDPTVTNGTPPDGRHVKHVTSRNIDCERCHYNYPSSLTHANGVLDTNDPGVNIVRFNIVVSGASWTNDTGARTGDCASVSCHASNTLGWYGTGTWTLPPDCTICHSSNYSSVLDPLVTNGTDTDGKHVNHVTNSHIACSKCHYNYPTKTSHANGSMDTPDPAVLLVYFDATNPIGTWTNDTGPETGTCSSLFCHGTENPAWYGLAGVSFPPCAACHSGPIGTRRQTFGAGGDFAKNAGIKSHHVSGGNDPTSTQCLVCHDLSFHMSGTVYVKNADSGAAIVYDPALPSTLEPFCLSCHDADGATATLISGGTPTSPFNDGSVLGGPPPNLYQAGNKIAGYWNGSGNTHKASGGLTCAGTGVPGTGCHGNNGKINMHGSSVKGLLTNNMNFQIPLTFDYTNPVSAFVYDNYKLCLDCHDSYPSVSKEVVLGYKRGGKYDPTYPFNWAPTPYYTSGIQSLFRDRYIASPANYPSYWGGVNQPYNNDVWLADYAPLHNYHLLGDIPTWLSWKYRGDIAQVGRITCTTCHNVHGTNGTVRITYQEFGIRANFPYTPLGPDEYKMFDPITNYDDAVMRSYPINCNVSCHEIMGPTAYWHTPSDE